ncbi:hypothetical protein [Pseudomonas sp. LRF_L74]|uniref:hypothetical protein n=1 Tax=Pseudomonas sp. LRF_L74 TaxID=3369422 RepID=UPI003F617337
MKRLVLLILLMTVVGCSATSKSYEKKGRKGLNINCSGLSSNWDQCEKNAAASCGTRGYKVIARSGDDASSDDSNTFLFGINPAGFSSRSMVVICR